MSQRPSGLWVTPSDPSPLCAPEARSRLRLGALSTFGSLRSLKVGDRSPFLGNLSVLSTVPRVLRSPQDERGYKLSCPTGLGHEVLAVDRSFGALDSPRSRGMSSADSDRTSEAGHTLKAGKGHERMPSYFTVVRQPGR